MDSNNNIEQLFSDNISKILNDNNINLLENITVALSGGCDSMALAFLLKDYCCKNNITLKAITIDHQIRDDSHIEAKMINDLMTKHDIDHCTIKIDKNNIKSSNTEANLRQHRYQLLHDFCLKNNIKYLFVGHHLSDIAENYLIRLFRGSGLDGLSPIADFKEYDNIYLIRPLLNIYKDDLKNYLNKKNIIWFEDSSNKDEKFLRNKIRNFLQTLPDSKLIEQRISNTSSHIAKIRDNFDHYLAYSIKKTIKHSGNSYLIDKINFVDLEEEVALKILALILMEVGQRNYKPRILKLRNLYQKLKNFDKKMINFYGCTIANNNNYLKISCENNDKIKRFKSHEVSKIKYFLTK